MGVQGFWQSIGPIIGIREPTPLKLVQNKRLDIVFYYIRVYSRDRASFTFLSESGPRQSLDQ